ncbi:MAG: sigma-70 family RNA polymerase sigma factor [Flavobacteriales bacterium]|nr:sigma-70 family RNA polymerase sigma factor [Flavobacteriales bacterium]
MTQDQNIVEKQVNHLYRHEYGKLVSVLTKTFGVSNIELAEDVVQDAMLEAMEQWAYKGVPDNPVGWIYKVAKNKAVNIVNRDKYKQEHSIQIAQHLLSNEIVESDLNDIFTDKEIADDQLRMMFTCCHPVVSSDSQIALTLKTLCGFSIPEIASAFLTSEENINKRLVRARKNIKEAKVDFEVPVGKDLEPRLNSVLETIYLLFNEGYNATSGSVAVRYDLCEEAIRLTELIASNTNLAKSSNVFALLALMSLNASRFKARIDEYDNIVDLEHQDRSKWNLDLMQKGLQYLYYTTEQNQVSAYYILATISAHHCTAKDFASTDWDNILSLYDNLIQIVDTPIVQLNRAVVVSKTSNAAQALKDIDKIKDKNTLNTYLPYYTVKAELHIQNNELGKATALLKAALNLPINDKLRSEILNKLEKI